jgi:hypothetical protein
MTETVLSAVTELLHVHFTDLTLPIRKSLSLMTAGFLRLLASVIGGQGTLTLGALIRAMPSPHPFHSRENRLRRLLNNRRVDSRAVSSGLASLILGGRRGCCPVLVDQTKSGATQALAAAVPYAGRALPLSVFTFDYPLRERNVKSQNQLEHLFLLNLEESLPPQVAPVWIGDQGYARAMLFRQCEVEGRLYIIRGRKGTGVTWKGQRQKLHQLRCEPYRAVRYEDVQYHFKRRVDVDVVVYWEPEFKKPWWLITPRKLRALASPEQVVELYRERMQIEQSFRDFKTHLGLRGLRLLVNVAERTGRLLVMFLLAYALAVILGDGKLAAEAREILERPRQQSRHGTTATLSALTIARQILSDPAWAARAEAALLAIIQRAIRRRPLLPTTVFLAGPKIPP